MAILFGWSALTSGALTPLESQPSHAPALEVSGQDEAAMLLPEGVGVAAAQRHGYSLVVSQLEDGRRIANVTVEVERLPTSTRTTVAATSIKLPRRRSSGGQIASNDPIGRLARSLSTGGADREQISLRIQRWIARNVTYELDRGQDQSARAVLDRRTAYCTGVARLAVELLNLSGVPAREVAGMVYEGPRSGFHRWIEVELGHGLWLFSDPLYYHHFVPATYVPLASESVQTSTPELKITSRGARYRLRGSASGGGPGTYSRPREPYAGRAIEVVGAAELGEPGGRSLRLRLSGQRWQRTVELGDDLVVGFVDLEAGAGTLTLEARAGGERSRAEQRAVWRILGQPLRLEVRAGEVLEVPISDLLRRAASD